MHRRGHSGVPDFLRRRNDFPRMRRRKRDDRRGGEQRPYRRRSGGGRMQGSRGRGVFRSRTQVPGPDAGMRRRARFP